MPDATHAVDWTIPAKWQAVRERKRSLTEVNKAAGAFGAVIGKAADLRPEPTVSEERLRELQKGGFQYIVTMNSDAVTNVFPAGFDFAACVVEPRLTDATEDAGLFGVRSG